MDESIISNITEETNLLIDSTENISSLLQIWNEVDSGLRRLEESNEKIRTKIKNFLKEREWKKYNDEETKISVSITELTKENIDKNQLKLLLTDTQYSQVSNIKTFERLNIINSKRREQLNKLIRK